MSYWMDIIVDLVEKGEISKERIDNSYTIKLGLCLCAQIKEIKVVI